MEIPQRVLSVKFSSLLTDTSRRRETVKTAYMSQSRNSNQNSSADTIVIPGPYWLQFASVSRLCKSILITYVYQVIIVLCMCNQRHREHVFWSSFSSSEDFSVVFHPSFLPKSFIRWDVYHFEAFWCLWRKEELTSTYWHWAKWTNQTSITSQCSEQLRTIELLLP